MQVYLDALRHILEHGSDRPTRTGVDTRATFGMQMRFDMANGFPAVTTKRLAFKTVAAELLWFLTGSSDVNELRRMGCKIWDENAEAPYWKPKARFDGDLGRVYGVQWRHWRRPDGTEVDQIANLVAGLRTAPYERRHIVTAWNPGELDEMALPPCHAFFQAFVADGRLSLQLYQRSCDMFLGVPFNIASYSLLLHMLSQVTGYAPGEFIHTLGDAHIYHNHFEQVRRQLANAPYPPPTLWMNPAPRDLDAFRMDDFKLESYQHHGAIPAPMAV